MSVADREELVKDGVVPLKTEALKAYGLTRSTAYERMNAGELAYVKIGGRRFIPVRSLVAMLARGLVTASA